MDSYKFENSLVSILSSRLARIAEQDHVSDCQTDRQTNSALSTYIIEKCFKIRSIVMRGTCILGKRKSNDRH